MNQPLLSVNNLTHLYAPGKGFSDVSFDLWPGEVLGIVGESGSGKTTLLKSISARLTPVPPFTRVESLDFDDHPFTVQQWDEPCAICGSTHSYLDEVVLDDAGNRMFVCSDTDYCRQQSEAKSQ